MSLVWRSVFVPVVTASGCLFRGVWGSCAKCEGTFAAFFSHVVSGLASVNCHWWACFFWSVARTDACVGLSGSFLCVVFVCVCYIMCMCDAWCMHHVGIVSGVFSLFVIGRKKGFIIFILSQQSWNLCQNSGAGVHRDVWGVLGLIHLLWFRRWRWWRLLRST